MTDKNEKNRVKDIAKLAGVSPGTVSNALNNRRGVSERKRLEILRLADEIGYERVPHKRADEALRFIVFKRHGNVVDDTPFFSQLIKGIETESRKHGYELMVTHVGLRELASRDALHGLIGDSCEGLLLLATEMQASDMECFEQFGLPLVLIDNCFLGMRHSSVLINNIDGSFKAVKHLVDMGHRSIGLLHGKDHINNFYYRRQGFYEALSAFGLSCSECHELSLTSTLEGAYRDMSALLASGASLPTAFFAENDIISLGAVRALQENGLRVPHDISIIGFDDLPYCEIATPRLSTIRVLKREMGELAVRMLVETMRGPNAPVFKNEICTELVARDSVRMLSDAPEVTPSRFFGVL